MASYVICFCLVRLALPLCLAASVLFRQNLFSFIYLLLFFFSPWIRVPTVKHWKGCTQIYLMIVFLCSLTISLAQFIFQIVLLSLPPYAHFLENCCWLEKVLRHIGFVRLDTISSIRGVQALGPDALMLAASISIYIICKRAATIKERTEDDEIPVDITAQMKESRKKRNMFLIAVGKYVSLITLCVVGSLQPSILNGIYFVVFLGSVTWWACYKDLQKTFAVILHFIVLIASLHICALFSMQLQYLQEIIADRCNICRYLGLKALITFNCLEPNNFQYTDDDVPSFLNPVFLMWMYYVLALEGRLLIKPPVSFNADDDSLSFRENSPLIGSISPKSKYQSTSNPEKPHVLQDAMGSVTITDGPDENIHLQPLNDIVNIEDTKISPFEILLDCINSLFQVINKSAYIATNIIMMAWSIMYHSWLTFVLLLWASLLWMIPNQRRAMLRSSPFLVFYAELLLIAQYIYGMDLTDKELPQEVQGINLKQIGIEKPIGIVCKPLFIKILFTTMFWITLRQFMQERYEHRSTSTLQDLAAPLQVTVNTATSGFSQNDHRPSTLMTKLGDFFKYVLTRCLIWIVAIMLLVIGLTGTRMTLFRIVYTALFLIFVIIFQVSYKIWRKIMYGFWLTVIVYSMSILVLVYTYQFDNFLTYWENFGVPLTLQLDIGLERFETGELFVRLVPPTFFLIITVIQLHYFHKDFLEISDIKVRSADHLRRTSAGFPILPGTGISATSQHVHMDFKQEDKFHSILGKKVIDFGKKCKCFLGEMIDLSCLFLELHMLRIMLISIMLLCVYDVSTLHFGLLLLITIALPFGDRVQLVITHICVIIVSCLILAKMIYQIEYIKHDVNNVNCTIDADVTYGVNSFNANDIDWLGFHKSSADHSLGDLLKGYIGIIVVATILAFVNTRQIYMRRSKGQSSVKPTLMFAGVTRSDADKNVALCIKYIFNFGFYKFGVEVCLMTLVALIATRMDFFAVLYSIWLCIMFAMMRETILNVWSFFKIFMIIILPVQYALAVGLPPTLCIDYPWYSNKVLARFQQWMFFPDPLNQPDASRLICDFLLLMMVCRQSMVFNIEKQTSTIGYPGGSNKDISKEVQDPSFVNPVPDHITYVRSWLDIFKRVVMGGFMWFTLAVVFLAGTNRVNLFSVGYLCGSFVFLWQGEEMYLRPLKTIIRWWNFLLAFNVSVITLKALLQIAGCIFIDEVKQDATWALQLFGIACINDNSHLEHYESTKSAEDVSLAWDGVCFGFIIMLRRLFNSYYFVHLVNEAKAMALLASRGAELIEELRLKQITDQQEQEYEILEKIKKKMERIKATQQKIKGETYKQPRSHLVEGENIVLRRRFQSNRSAILSGDYYMFEEFDDELDLLEEEKDESPSMNSDDSSKRLTLNELLAAAMKTDVQQAVGMAQKKKESVDHAVMTRKKSSFFSIHSRTSRQDPATSQPMSDETLPSPAESFYSTERRELDITTEALDKKQEIKDDEIIESIPSDEEELSTDYRIREPLHTSRWYAYFRFAIAFLESAIETFSKKLNTLSRDYRYVMKVLSLEKKTLKESPSFNRRVRLHSDLTWEPVPLSSSERTALSGIQAISLEEMDHQELSASSQPAIVRLVLSAWYAVISHSDLVCYFMVFILQMKSATILSLPLPLMVFLWGTLSVPRPTKTFWVTMIAYTEVIVIVKCMFQFDFVPWNQQAVAENAPFFPPRIIGIEGRKHYAIYDLLLLLIIFFHRFMLKSLGLWKSTYEAPNEYVKGEKIYELMEEEDAVNLKEQRKSTKSGFPSSAAYESRFQSRRHEDIVTVGGLKLLYPDQSGGGDNDDKMNKTTLIVIKTENAILLEHFPRIIIMGVKRYLFAIQLFFQQLLSTSLRVTTDVYAYMFMCDFFNLIVLIIGFASFGTQQGDGGVSSYLKEDKVPIPFLIMTILQFGLIIIDRALFLRKYILGKVVFQFFLVFGIHIWMFFILPAVTDRPFNAALPPQMWYMVKCIYLLLSAYQIRSGYPTRILGNFLCKKYNIINMILFKGFMLIPFLFELRALMDWIWTDTSMTLFDWLKMEDIFGNIFQLKCSRRMEAEYPQPRGERKRPIIKYLMGGGLLFIIIGIIWFPLVFFALGSTVGEPNTPYEVDLNLRIGTYQPIFKMSAQNSTIYRLSDVQFTQFSNIYKKDKYAQTFLSNYDHDDIGVAIMNRNSTTIWTISPPDQKRLIEEMQSDIPIIVKLTWTIRRITNDPKIPAEITASKEWILQGKINNERNPVRDDFVKVLLGTDTKNSVMLNYLLPKFLKVTNQGQANAVNQLMEGKDSEQQSYRNVSLKLYSGKFESDANSEEWWEMSEVCNDSNYKEILQHIPLQDCDDLVVYTFNDKSFPSTLTFISGAGIIGLYTTLVLIASNIVRGFFTGVLATIMFDDLPNVDRILQLCLDIYLVRESGELALEEDLFAKLIFLYRSPETLIKWTRPREEGEGEGDGGGDGDEGNAGAMQPVEEQ